MRQQIRPIHIAPDGTRSAVLQKHAGILERDIQALIHAHPEILPIGTIDPAFLGAVSICRELNTPAGPIDNLLITPTGLPVIVECKLWSNPQARREVVGQALDYAKELARWTSADLEREASRRDVPSLAGRLRQHHPDLDEAAFHDTLSRSLARGRMLLLIVGDGIKENVESIFEHLRVQGALHFSFGLVEMPIFDLPDGSRIVVPRAIAHSVAEVRQVVQLPEGLGFEEAQEEAEGEENLAQKELGDRNYQFWSDLLERLVLDDPEQPLPKPSRASWLALSMPVQDKCCWLTVYRMATGSVGVVLAFNENGRTIVERTATEQGDSIRAELPDITNLMDPKDRNAFRVKKDFGDLGDPRRRDEALKWLALQVNRSVNVLRPAIRRVVDELRDSGERG